MQEKRHDCVVEMQLCFFSFRDGDYKVLFVSTRKCRSTTDAFLYVLTNTEVTCGAVYMFDEELMARIAERLDSSLLILPSSTHEILLLRETEDVDVFDLRLMVEGINKDVVRPEDKLSDEVYRYDRAAHKLNVIKEQDYLQDWQIKIE